MELRKTFQFEAAHLLPNLPLTHKCRRLHGHSFQVEIVVAGDIDPARGSEIEEAVWARMHFASHLRSERLGEFTIGTDLHRSDSLAIVQLLVLYHLVTARAKIALGGAEAATRG